MLSVYFSVSSIKQWSSGQGYPLFSFVSLTPIMVFYVRLTNARSVSRVKNEDLGILTMTLFMFPGWMQGEWLWNVRDERKALNWIKPEKEILISCVCLQIYK